MTSPRNIIASMVVIVGLASVLFALLDTVSLKTVAVLLGVGLIILSAAVIQKQ